jgi:hypothetical protein
MKQHHLMVATTLAAGLMLAPAVQAQGVLDLGRMILGLPSDEQKPQIDYKERAPLVVPPSQNLRPPAEALPADQRRANWPQDPDVLARRKAAEDARRPIFVPNDRELGRVMTPAEIRAQGRTANGVPSATVQAGNPERPDLLGGIANLRSQAARQKTEVEVYAEPPREYLTDPPRGVRAAAGNAPVRATRETGTSGDFERPDLLAITRDGPRTR